MSTLQNLSYNPGFTVFDYNGDGLFKANNNRVNQIGIVQHFPSPSVHKAMNVMQDEMVKMGSLQKLQTANNLRKKVREIYNQLQFQKALKTLYLNIVQTYTSFRLTAKKRYDVGVVNKLELLMINASLNEYKLLESQANIQIIRSENQLKNILNIEDPVTSINELIMLDFVEEKEFKTLSMAITQQQISTEQAKISVLKSNRKPSFNIGYAAQNYFDDNWLHGLQAGVRFSLFNKQNKNKIRSQKMLIEVAHSRYQAEQLHSYQQLLTIENTIDLYQEGIKYYKSQMDNINPEIERISQLNYNAGEISYIELLNTLSLSANNNKKYLEQISSYNDAVIMYQFLLNK